MKIQSSAERHRDEEKKVVGMRRAWTQALGKMLRLLASVSGCGAYMVASSAPAHAEVMTLKGAIGEIQMDTTLPAATSLRLRTASGALDAKSILSPKGEPWLRGVPDWGTQAYTYAVDAEGRRYESRIVPPDAVDKLSGGGLRIRGVKLVIAVGASPVATENWTLQVEKKDLVWTVERTWKQAFTARLSASPGLFFSTRPLVAETSRILENGVATTWWIDPTRLRGEYEPLLRPVAFSDDYKHTRNNSLWVAEPNTWAVFKLWTNWHHRADLRLETEGGHLLRRGWFGWIGEGGVVAGGGGTQRKVAGQVERTTLRIAPSERTVTGYQLAVDIPDKPMQETLSSFYSSLMNGGVVADQLNYDFGNQVDGWYYAGSSWMQGFALSAGVPQRGQLAQRPYDWANAFRGRLSHVIGTMLPDGRTRFGYNGTGEFVDDNLHTIIGAHAYLMHSGDLAFIRQQLPALEKMLDYFIKRRNAIGLYDLGPAGHWYYDAMPSSGVNSYHNAFFFKALNDLADMQGAAGAPAKAANYSRMAADVKRAFNEVLWFEDAPGGARYCDWITPSGEKVSYGADVCQWPPVALGIASPAQGRKLIATLDRRIAVLKTQYGYTHQASFSAYWPVPDHLNGIVWQRAYPIYMNGGSFLAQTYWEVLARARSGDADGARDLLKRFADGARKTSYTGNNWITVKGEIGNSPSDEPYLSDMVVVPASLVTGILGVQPKWDKLEVRPNLPNNWKSATADIVYKGEFYRVEVWGGAPRIKPLGRRLAVAPPLEFEVRGASIPWAGFLQRDFTTGDGWSKSASANLRGGRAISLGKRVSPGVAGHWPLSGVAGANPLADVSGRDNLLSASAAGVTFGEIGPSANIGAARFDGKGTLTASDSSPLVFGPTQSFTVQCWFKTTDATMNGVLVVKGEAYCLTIKEGKLAGWVMADRLNVREAVGSANAADGKWHHAALVVDRVKQQLSLYLDGQLDTSNGATSATNPVDISAIGASTSTAPFALGSLGGSYAYNSLLADVSALTSARPPVVSPDGSVPVTVANALSEEMSGWYLTSPASWGAPAQTNRLRVDAKLNGGAIKATIEVSHDNCATVAGRYAVTLREGLRGYLLPKGALPLARAARVRFDLTRGNTRNAASPEVRSLRLFAVPTK